MSQTEVTALHRRAMDFAEQAMFARARHETERAAALTREALDAERRAAMLVLNLVPGLEPTRSVLLRSAASLALECGETREAERLIAQALTGEPDDVILDELRDLLEQVYFQRHLDLRGLRLDPMEFQLSLNGSAIGFGIAEKSHFIGRVNHLEAMLYRTAERKRGQPFKEGGTSRKLQQDLQLYLSAPRAASFAVTFRLGARQFALPGMDFVQDVVDEVLDCIDVFSQGDGEPLAQRIPDEAYRRNFIGLARKIAPDGQQVTTVGITAVRGDRERRVVLAVPRDRVLESLPPGVPQPTDPGPGTIRGFLKYSDSRNDARGTIRIVDAEGRSHSIAVPIGMMRDIVRPMYEDEVVVKGRRKGQTIILETIDPAPSDPL
jgi:hypothetical protein